jgi:serine/threonine protein kinase
MSPEQIDEEKYDEKSDIWSAGCILYEIAALKPPFEAQNKYSLAIKIRDGKYGKLPKIYSEEIWRIINLMMSTKKENRPSVDDLLNVPMISMRLREKRLRDTSAKLKKRDEELKLRELKIVDMEAKISQLEKQLDTKDAIISEKDLLLSQKDKEIEAMKKQLEVQVDYTPAPIMSETPVMSKQSQNYSKLSSVNISEHTPIPSYQRGSNTKLDEVTKSSQVSIYDSLKQEIKSLSTQITLGAPN